jgi:hypothetical protein
MVSEVQRIGILRAGKVGAVLYGLLGLALFPLAMLGAMAGSAQGLGLLLMVALYPLLGLVGAIIFAALYNVTAKLAGGIQFASTQVSDGRGYPSGQNIVYQQP